LIRDYVDGTLIEAYIRQYKLSVNLAENLIELIENFKNLGFPRLDIRCEHIFIQEDVAIIIIDPRQTYNKVTPYPNSILKSLNKLGVLDDFFNTLQYTNVKLYKDWSTRYIYDINNDVHY